MVTEAILLYKMYIWLGGTRELLLLSNSLSTILPEKTTLSNSEFCSIMNSTMRYSCISLGRRFRLYVYEAILYLNHKFGTVTGKKKRNHSPNGHSETRKGYSNPFFQNFPTDFLFGMWMRRYDHIIDNVLGVDAEAFFLSAWSLAGPCRIPISTELLPHFLVHLYA